MKKITFYYKIQNFLRYKRHWYVFYTTNPIGKELPRRDEDFEFRLSYSHTWFTGFVLKTRKRMLVVNLSKELKNIKYPSNHIIKVVK